MLKQIQNVSKNLTIPIADVIRFFHGEGPAMQCEAGNQRGGH